MAKKTETAKIEDVITDARESTSPKLDSKYRMIILAAQRSKQLQRGARPRVELDSDKHKPTRIALMEIKQNKLDYELTERR